MKTPLTQMVLSLMIVNYCHGQITSFKSFIIEDRELIYQQVFDTAVALEDASDYYNSLSKAKNVKVFEDYLTAEFENEEVDLKRYGRKWGTTPMLFGHDNFSGKVKLEFKEDRYRLTIFGIKTVAKTIYGSSGDISSQALKKNNSEIRPVWATEDLLGLIHEFLLDNFRIKSSTKKEW